MCDECARLQQVYGETSEGLRAAQSSLARYDVRRERERLSINWERLQNCTRTLWKLRDEIARHAATHGEDLTVFHRA